MALLTIRAFFCTFLIGWLLVGLPPTPALPSPPVSPVTLGPPQAAGSALDRRGAWFNFHAPFSGRLVYPWDTGPVVMSGNDPPWRSFLTLHTFQAGRDTVLTREVIIPNYQVNVPRFQVVLQPLFSPDGSKVLFKIGDIGSRFSTSDLYLWELEAGRLEDLNASLFSDENAFWSPDGRFFARWVGGRYNADDRDQHPAELYVYEIATRRDKVLKNISGFDWIRRDRRSPDGRWLAYFPLPSNPEDASWRLMLRPRHGGRAQVIQRGRGLILGLCWRPDSRGLVIVTRRGVSDVLSQARIVTYDFASRKIRKVATLLYDDYPNSAASESLFNPLSVSKNNEWLFVVVTQPNDTLKAKRGEFLRAVRLSDGAVSTLCFIPGYHGLDWREQ